MNLLTARGSRGCTLRRCKRICALAEHNLAPWRTASSAFSEPSTAIRIFSMRATLSGDHVEFLAAALCPDARDCKTDRHCRSRPDNRPDVVQPFEILDPGCDRWFCDNDLAGDITQEGAAGPNQNGQSIQYLQNKCAAEDHQRHADDE